MNLDPLCWNVTRSVLKGLGVVLIWITSPVVFVLQILAMCLGSAWANIYTGWVLGKKVR